jgi:serine/threonine-protein kinase
MDSARWNQMQALFHEAVDLSPGERIPFLLNKCAGDISLMDDVLAMLAEDARENSLLSRDVAQVAGEILGDVVRNAFPEFGPYRIKSVLGEGGMGIVYLAEREDLGIEVAIKIQRDVWLSPARRERFASERRTLAQLNHPSIARLYDAGARPDGTPWFVMAYVDGVPLTEYCTRHHCGVEQRLKLFRTVCEAVQHAHQHAVIHRDLKPSNILVKSGGSIRLLDFGIAKQLNPMETPADHTRTGIPFMTPAYASPEQIRGERVSIHSDVYSLGVILYQLLSGMSPARSGTPARSPCVRPMPPANTSHLIAICKKPDANCTSTGS